jgi:transcriptional regulator with XRE-family HTH domain
MLMSDLDELSKLLKDLRLQRGWDRGDLEARSGVTRKSLKKYEQGDSTPRITTLHKLAQAYGFSASELLDDIDL